MMSLPVLLACLIVLANPLNPIINISMHQDPLTYLALGDSYTIGESVPVSERWPEQLASRARDAGVNMNVSQIIATTGWTTAELKEGIARADLGASTYDLVSLLIGVNNQYRGYDFEIFEKEFRELLQQAIQFAGGDTANVCVVSIPDYGVTPFGQKKDPEKIFQELNRYNAYQSEVCRELGVAYLDITPISREAEDDEALVAQDLLHPSGKMYKRWVNEVIFPWLAPKLK